MEVLNGSSVLQWHHRYNIVKALASAVLYLHEEWDEKVIHRNITSSAVILEADMNPRLSSFALAEFLSRNEHGHHVVTDTRKSVRGIFGYMSPEYVKSGEATTEADVYSFGVVVLEVVSGQMAVDFRQPEVLLVKKVHEFEMRKRPLKELADTRLNGEYNDQELMRLVRLGIACTRCDPQVRPSMRQIVSILDGNDKLLVQNDKESREEWRQINDCSLSMIKRIQALGIHFQFHKQSGSQHNLKKMRKLKLTHIQHNVASVTPLCTIFLSSFSSKHIVLLDLPIQHIAAPILLGKNFTRKQKVKQEKGICKDKQKKLTLRFPGAWLITS
ncbi:Receptor like protein kinase S.2, partial [Mucuna pruriens]